MKYFPLRFSGTRVAGLAAFVWILAIGPAMAGLEEGDVSQNDARQIVLAMIEAHGGMEGWKAAPTVSFEDQLFMGDASSPVVSRVVVEQGPRRVYMDYPGTETRLAWDGERAWSENWISPHPPRFTAQLNYYFLNLPWLSMDPGVHLGHSGTARLWEDPTEYVTVKMTFEDGVGDTPNDYYVLYIHPTDHRLKAVRYIVTYGAMLPEGVEATPEHILVYEEFTTVNDLSVPTRYTIYETNHSVIAKCMVRDWSFEKPFDAGRMIMSPGAVVDTSQTGS